MDYRALSDAALLETLRDLARKERGATSDFVACLSEVDRRPRVVLAQGYASLYDFCVRDLRLAQSSAYKRVAAAREARRRPEILSYLRSGDLNLSVLGLIAPSLETHPCLLEDAKGKSKREVEELLASLGAPKVAPDRVKPVRPVIPTPTGIEDLFASPRESEAMPRLAAAAARPVPVLQRVEFRFVADASLAESVERLRALLWHKHPAGRLEDVLSVVCTDYLQRHDPGAPGRLVAAASPAAPSSRKVPPRIKRLVWKRDDGRCSFIGPAGRCAERRGLELDHVVPWALGGRSTADNLRLLCRPHNQAEAERIFGKIDSPRGESCG